MMTIKILIVCLLSILGIGNYRITLKENTTETVADALVANAKSAILIEVETGSILYEYNAHEKRSPASMTKIMSIKLIMDALKNDRLNQNQILTTSEYASSMGGSQIYLSVNEQMSVADLFKSMVIASANDSTVVLAEAISGSENNFVKMMNEEVKKLGLKNTHFEDSTGLTFENHYSTAYDMAMIARSLLLEHENEIIPITSTYESYIRTNTNNPFWLVNTNKLVKHVEGIDGLKTGWTTKAGYCLTCTKKVNGMRLVSVVMGCDRVENRSKDTVALLNYGFANYQKEVILPKGSKVEVKENLLYSPNQIKIVTSSDLIKVIKKSEKIKDYQMNYHINEQAIKELKIHDIGELKVTFEDGEELSVSLEVVEKYKKSSFWKLLISLLEMVF